MHWSGVKVVKKKVLYTIYILLLPVYAFYIYYCFARIPLTSDMANLILEADDILHGNLFLSGWYLTGATFLTTELLYFTIGTLINGVNQQAYILAETLMFVAAFSSALLLLKFSSRYETPLCYILLFISLTAVPSIGWCTMAKVHLGWVGWGFLALYFLAQAHDRFAQGETKQPSNTAVQFLLAASLFLTLAITGDALAILTIAVPTLIVSSLELIKQFNITRTWKSTNKSSLYAILATVVPIVLAKLINVLYLKAGKADITYQVDGALHFLSYNDITNSLINYAFNISTIFNADIQDLSLSLFYVITLLPRLIILLVALYVVFRNVLRSLLLRLSEDYVSLILSWGIFIVSSVCILSNFNAGRYYSYAPFALVLILVRYLQAAPLQIISTKLSKPIILATACFFMATSLYPPVSFSAAINPRTEMLINVLKNYNLTSGYGSYWCSSVITAASNKEVTVRSISVNNSKLSLMTWFCKKSWYDAPANFVITHPAATTMTENDVLRDLGQPQAIIPAADFKIYVYDHDISPLVR